MSIELKVPEVGESVSEVQLGEWLRQEGDLVERDQALATIETDKVTVEIAAPARGRLAKIILQKGATAHVGDVVALFNIEEETAQDGQRFERGQDRAAPSDQGTPPPVVNHATATVDVPMDSAAPWASPAARRALAERGLRPEDLLGASGGRILKQDVARHVSAPTNTPGAIEPAPTPSSDFEEVVKMSPMRLRVAERLLESQQTMALLTTFNEIDMSSVQELRREVKTAFVDKHGTKLGLMSFFVRACLEALKAFPVVNAEVRGTDIVYKNHYDIGIAVGGGRGLVVPVIRNVERMGFAAIERAINDFATRAKDNKLELRELVGGTFTISNGGVYGSMLSTPIVNPPQSAILGLHAITDRPVARDGQVVVRPMMYVALTYDHRIIDGREAVSFVRTVKDLVENPIRMLLEL